MHDKEGGGRPHAAISPYIWVSRYEHSRKRDPFSHVPVMVSHETLTFSALLIREIVFLKVGVIKGKLKFVLDTSTAEGATSLP